MVKARQSSDKVKNDDLLKNNTKNIVRKYAKDIPKPPTRTIGVTLCFLLSGLSRNLYLVPNFLTFGEIHKEINVEIMKTTNNFKTNS